MRRGALTSAVVSALLLTAAAPFGGVATAAACPSWTDAAGDSNVQGQANLPDETVDITGVRVEQSTHELRATFFVPELGNVNAWLPGDRFELAMSAGGTPIAMAADRDDVNQGRRVGVVNGGTFTTGGQAVYDLTKRTVEITVPFPTFDAALGKAVKGLPLTTLVANVRGAFAPMSFSTPIDTAPAPASLALPGGRVCGDGRWGAATILPVGAAGPITAERPAAGCSGVEDDKGDGRLPNANPNVPTNDPDLDIHGVTMRAADKMLYAYLKVDALAAGPKTTDGHRFSIDFVFNNHLFTVAASQYKNPNSPSVREGMASQKLSGRMVQMSLDTPPDIDVAYARSATVSPTFVESGSKAFFDVPNSTVVIGIPIADIQKYGGTRFHGAEITSIVARSTGDLYRNSLIADTAPAAAATQYSWVAGQNTCFSLPTRITLTSVKAPATRTVVAKVTTTGGEAVVGKPVTFLVKGKKSVVETGADGVATLKGVKPGSHVTASFAPSTGYRGSTAAKKV